jgi:glycogen synthase
MHICLVSREYPPFFGGGIGTYTVQFGQALATAGHRVTIVTVSNDGSETREQAGPITIVRLPFIQGDDWTAPHPAIDTPEHRAAFHCFAAVSVLAMQVARALPQLHDEFRFDVIEAPDTGALAWFLLNARRTGNAWANGGPAIVSCIHSPSDWILHFNRAPVRYRQQRELIAMERDSLRWADAVVCPSHDVAAWAEQHSGLSPGDVTVIPHCLGDLEAEARIHATARDNAQAEPRAPGRRILFASRLEPRKGVDTLLAGFALAVQAGADLHLDLAGQDTPAPDGRGEFGRRSLETFVPAELRTHVRLLGKQPPELVARMQSTADVVAIPSPMDNFPYACMEAMARGRLVLAGRAGGMSEMIEDGTSGILFTPGDTASCAAALRRIAAMSPDQITDMGRRAAERMLAMCGNEHIAARRVDHYREAIARRRQATASPRQPRPTRLVNPNAASAGEAARLTDAVALGACDFAHGWLRRASGQVIPFSTPRAGRDGNDQGTFGPVALTADVASHSAIAPLLRETSQDRVLHTDAPAALMAGLLDAGFVGAVVPDVITALDQKGEMRILDSARSAIRRVASVLRAVPLPGSR